MKIDIRLQELSTDKAIGWKTVVDHRGTTYRNAGVLLASCMIEYINQPNVKAMRFTLTITEDD